MASEHPIIGQTFERLRVKQRDYERGDCHYICECECGKIKSVRSPNLVHERVKSCGCLHKENATRRIAQLNKQVSQSYFDSPGEVPRKILLVLSNNPSGTLTGQINCGSTTRRHLFKLEAHKAIYRVPDGHSFRWHLTAKGWDKVFQFTQKEMQK